MAKKYDIEKLRRDMIDDRYAAAYTVVPEIMMEVFELERASDDEILFQARREGIDLKKYEL